MKPIVQDDRIYPITRVALAIVVVALLFAFLVLYLYPQTTRTNFAWEIKPQIMAVFMGAGYISGAYMFVFAIFGSKWHRVKNSLLPVSAFAASMLLVTLLHYDRFLHANFAFKLWLLIYIVTPFLVPWLWYHNRPTDPGTPEPNDKVVPLAIRWVAGLVGIVTLLFWLVNFIDPALLMSIWPWKLTPLTARTVCAWGALISVGGLVLFGEPRWSAWRYNLQSIALWQVLMVIGSIVHRQDFNNGSLLNPYFFIIVFILFMISMLYLWMEFHRSGPAPARKTSEMPGIML
jgi:hypothetical protein